MSTLYEELINPKLKKGQNGEQFWGQFNNLDNPGPPTKNFLAIQIEKLSLLEKSSQLKYKEANRFLKKVQNKTNQHKQVQDKIGNETYSRIIELMNAGLRGSKDNPYKNVKTKCRSKEEIQADAKTGITQILEELRNLLEKIEMSPEISTQMVNTLEKRLSSFDWDSETPHSYIMEKANLIEALMVSEMSKNKNLKAYITGSWVDDSGQQLIEDAFAFAKNDKKLEIPFSMGSLNYTITVDGKKQKKQAGSIKDFLSQIDSLNGTKFSVHLSDELYQALQKGAAVAGQAKSGKKGQSILNKNARNAISLGEINFTPMDLWNLYNLDLQTKIKYFKPEGQQNSKTLEALTNYCLSKNIIKTALRKNQVYLTEDGFVTASQWMDKYKKYLVFSPGITKINRDFLTHPYPYYFNEDLTQ